MPTPQIPFRTVLGQEELRQRRRELGQRHRTILFMVDGRRELAEVLSLAHQAGATTMHFEDLVRHGLVELPRLPEPAAVAAPSDAAIETFEAEADGHLARVDVVALPVARAKRTPPREPRREPVLAPEPPAAQPEPEPAPVLEALAVAPPVEAAAVDVPMRQRFRVSRGLKPAPPPDAAERFVPPIAAPNLVEDEAVLADVRVLLLEALRLDPPSFASRLPQRVRAANDTQQLIDLIWELEREPGHRNRSHRGNARLHDARELLGMGNTQVAEDSRPDVTEF